MTTDFGSIVQMMINHEAHQLFYLVCHLDELYIMLGFINGNISKCSHETNFPGSLNLFKVNFLMTFWFSIQEVKENLSQWLFRFADFVDVLDQKVNPSAIKGHQAKQVWC